MQYFFKRALPLLLTIPISALASSHVDTSNALYSIDTGYTISKVRSANHGEQSIIAASSYEGTVLAISYDGNILWENKLSGFMNHDLWTADITNDGKDEIFAANADGHIYCLSDTGKLLWSFKPNETPMYSVTVVHKNGQPYIAAGGYDNSFYYLDKNGKLLNEIKSSSYSAEKEWKNKNNHDNPHARHQLAKRHSINYLRPIKKKNGDDILFVHGTANSMQSRGIIYLFNPLDKKPFSTQPVKASKTATGDIRIVDINNDGSQEVILGSTKMKGQNMMTFDPITNKQHGMPLGDISKKFLKFGYRVTQNELIEDNGKQSFFILYGNLIAIVPVDNENNKSEILTGKFSYNDMWKDPKNQKIMLASSQSGGSSIHIIDTSNSDWKKDFEALVPPGKITKIINNTASLIESIQDYKAPKSQREPLPVYLMSDYRNTAEDVRKRIADDYNSPVFLGYGSLGSEKYDRAIIKNEQYRNKKDKRQKYNLSQDQILAKAKKLYNEQPGAAYWGGHGNDPYFRRLDTHLKTLEVADGKRTVMIFPELAHYDSGFEYMLANLMYPLAEASAAANNNIFLRNKHTFWQSLIYNKGWSRLISGEFADVFVPAMEETTDKSMELSIAARSGLWASGAVNDWGTRFSRDNTSFDRLRQHSHQMLPNHALRQFVYHIASGAKYVNNFAAVDNEYLGVYWDLIGKGILYTPKPEDILSFSPVHLSMLTPDGHYVDEGNNVKTTSLFDKKVEDENKMVFSRLNGTWPGSPVTEWDFSRYAAGVKDRYLNYLPPYPNGLVMITPPQSGVNADQKAPRGKLVDRLHPIYKNIMTEFYSDGRHYYSADGKETYAAEEYYQVIEKAIKEKAKLLPITVTGNVSWVVAQTSPTNLRLTLVDGGYINPQSALATVTFNTINPVKITDIVDGTKFSVKDSITEIQLPTGLFRFIDIELAEPLK